MNPYERLANAIVLQAVKDYRKAYKALKRNPDNRAAKDAVASLIRFFTGSWYSTLTSVDGEYLVRRLNEKIDKELRDGK